MAPKRPTSPSKQPPRSRGSRSGSASRSAKTGASPTSVFFDGHGHDVAGTVLIAVGILAGLSMYADLAGFVGRGLVAVIGAVTGVLKYVAPVVLIAVGTMLVIGPRRHETDEDGSTRKGAPAEDDSERSTTSRIIGGLLAWLSVSGIVHVIANPPSISDGLDSYADAGGYVGALLGQPLEAFISPIGASVVLVLVLIVSLSLISGRPLRELGANAADGFRAFGRALAPVFGGLFRVGEAPEEPEPAPKPARKPRVKADRPAGESKQSSDTPPEPKVVLPTISAPTEAEQLEINLEPRPDSDWKLPALSLLSRSKSQKIDEKAIRERGRVLEGALSEHGVTTRLSGMVVGPTITRYELELGVGTKVNQVTSLAKDIAYAMASPDVRIIAPIPGKQAIGVEVPNAESQIVRVGDIIRSAEMAKAKSPLDVAVGRDIEGKSIVVDLAKMPHLLIAGQTGSGKSSCINSIMTSILMRSTPDDVRLILVDPKRVELTQYNRVPHLLTEVVTDPKKAANALGWAVTEMERRYELLEEVGVRDLGGYNAAFDRGDLVAKLGEEREFDRLPLIMVVVDELADLMMVAARDVEESINRIAAKARAVGIHLVIATQRPSVNVITGVIKANIPARFAFSVASGTDSKVIMNQGGAERLVGKGDMLFMDPARSTPDRIQGCFADEREVNAVVEHWRAQAKESSYQDDVQDDSNLAVISAPSGGTGGGSGSEDDDLFDKAVELVVYSNSGSTSMLQRKLKVGFSRAGRIMDLLEEGGIVGEAQGSKPRDVLISVEQYEARMAESS